MKKLLILAFIFTSIFTQTHAGSEEDACFLLLNEAVWNDQRFKDSDLMPNWDLTNVLYDESNNSYYDFWTYSNFRVKRAENTANTWYPYGDEYYFEARRNNIGTIIAWNNYVISQISGFWRDSNFDFPLESKTWTPFGDKYKFNGNFFKEYVLYTHHVNSYSESYPLMSCGIVKVTPLWWRTFSDINESGYMTNILNGIEKQDNLWNKKCASWFEWEYVSEWDKDYYKMKANVCVQSYDESDYLKLEVISIAYDNDSSRLNEYYTHPLQVEAMRDNANHAQWLKWIQDVFASKLVNETCYSVIHGYRYNLPERCNNTYGPVSYQSKVFSLWDILFPVANANLDISNTENIFEEEEDTWLMIQWNLPYRLYEKLEAIPDESFREYMLLAVLPNFEELIAHRLENDVLLTPFEETFLSCWLDYNQRLEVVIDFLADLDTENFSLSNLDYTNESFWDCIIPYPDKDKISTVVDGSFDSNKLLAEKLSGVYAPPSDSPEVGEYIKKREEYLAELNTAISDIESRFNSWEIDINRANVLKIEQQEKTQMKIDSLDFSTWSLSDLDSEIIDETLWDKSDTNESFVIYYILIALLTLLWWAFIVFSFYKKNKNK